jgi:hypothetical protein
MPPETTMGRSGNGSRSQQSLAGGFDADHGSAVPR